MRPCLVRVLVRAACLMLAGTLLTSCSGSEEPSPLGSSPAAVSADPSASTSSSPSAGVVQPSPSSSGHTTTSSSPTDAALRLSALLGQHSALATDMMRARIRADADLAQAADSALVGNTAAIAQVLEPFVDAPAREQFGQMWGEHILALLDYARGYATKDPAVREHAREESVEYEEELADFFAEQSGGRLSRSAAVDAVSTHAHHLLASADAYAAGDHQTAARLYRESYAQSYALGGSLARALLPTEVTRTLETPSVRLRSELTRLLGEHVVLAVGLTRSVIGDRQDVEAMGTSLDANTLELTSAVESLFGAAPAARFQGLWADHVDQLAAYATATAAGDTAGQDRARSTLKKFETSLAGFLGAATANRLGGSTLAAAFADHDRMLLAQIDAYTASQFEQAHTVSNQTYDEMAVVAALLADAIGATIAARLPQGGSQTGGGGTAARTPSTSASIPSFRSVRTHQATAEPVRLRIPAAGIDTGLEHVALTSNGWIAAPRDWQTAGWFEGGPRPGQKGPAVIVGHVDSRAGPAVFYELPRLRPGAAVLVDRADGSTVRFRVSGSRRLPKDRIAAEGLYSPSLDVSLLLITCGGVFDSTTGHYRDNIVVTAVPG